MTGQRLNSAKLYSETFTFTFKSRSQNYVKLSRSMHSIG